VFIILELRLLTVDPPKSAVTHDLSALSHCGFVDIPDKSMLLVGMEVFQVGTFSMLFSFDGIYGSLMLCMELTG
jgi:hypothetical protein